MTQIDLKKFILPVKFPNTNNTKDGAQPNDANFDITDFVFIDDEDTVSKEPEALRQVTATDWAIANGAYHTFEKSAKGKRGTASYWLYSHCVHYANVCKHNDYILINQPKPTKHDYSECNHSGDENVRSARDISQISGFTAKTTMDNPNNADGVEGTDLSNRGIGLRPSLHLDIPSIISAQKEFPNHFKINAVTDPSGNELYHTIEFGEYPKSYVGNEMNKKLNKTVFSHRYKSSELTLENRLVKATRTDKKYLKNERIHSNCDYNGPPFSYEYEFRGQKYVYVKVDYNHDGFESKVQVGDNYYEEYRPKFIDRRFIWIKVEPIVWIIKNWDDLPTALNPNGNGTASYIDIKTEEVITTLPFYYSMKYAKNTPTTHKIVSWDDSIPDKLEKQNRYVYFTDADEYNFLRDVALKNDDTNLNLLTWKYSTLRGYLNGINSVAINEYVYRPAPYKTSFSDQNFLTEALVVDLDKRKKLERQDKVKNDEIKSQQKEVKNKKEETKTKVSFIQKFFKKSETNNKNTASKEEEREL